MRQKINAILDAMGEEQLTEVLDYLEDEYWQILNQPGPNDKPRGIVLGKMPDCVTREIERTMRDSGHFPEVFPDTARYEKIPDDIQSVIDKAVRDIDPTLSGSAQADRIIRVAETVCDHVGDGGDFENIPPHVQAQVSAIMRGENWTPPPPKPKGFWTRVYDYLINRD